MESDWDQAAFIHLCLLWAVRGLSKTCLIRVELTWFTKCLDQTLVGIAHENDEIKSETKLHSSICVCSEQWGRLKEPSFTASLQWQSWFLNLNTSRQKLLTKQLADWFFCPKPICAQISCLLWTERGVSRTLLSPHVFHDNLVSKLADKKIHNNLAACFLYKKTCLCANFMFALNGERRLKDPSFTPSLQWQPWKHVHLILDLLTLN